MNNNYDKSKTVAVLTFISSTILIMLIGFLKFYFKSEMAFTLFYMAPIVLVAWHITKPLAWGAICILSIISWFLAELFSSEYTVEWLIYWNAITMFLFFMTVAFLLGNLKILLQREKESARTDSLTGVSNSKSFYEISEETINRCHRQGSPLSIAYIDLDNFKQVNDTYGHITGDLLLQKVADSFKINIRSYDIAARLGGDEFVILFADTDYEQSRKIIERIQDELLSVMNDNSWPVTFSIGIVTFRKPPQTVEKMVQKADQTMYLIKNDQKNAIKHVIEDTEVFTDFNYQ